MSKEDVVQQVIDNYFSKAHGLTLEGVIRFLPKRIDKYGRMFGWDDEEFRYRVLIHIHNLLGFKKYLEKESEQ